MNAKIIAPHRRMEGGRLLGQGSYGCAFTPPLLCKSKSVGRNTMVGKITLDKDAEQEIHIANLLRKRPLVKNYLLLPEPESCEPAPLSQQTDTEIKDCDATSRKNEYKVNWSSTRQLYLPFGGKNPLGNMIMNASIHPKYFPFFEFMKHTLEAGALLTTAGICHFDLHPNNFIQDPYGVVRILDLGQAFDSRTIDAYTVSSRWKQLMFGEEKDAPNPMVTNAESPEITIINAMRNGFILDDAIRHTVAGKAIFRDMERLLSIPAGRAQSELKEFFTSSETAQKRDWVQFFKLYWTGFDAWSIGAVLLNVLKYQVTWVEFQQGEWRQKQAMTKLTLQGLLNPNPRKRLDCVEALFLFDPNNAWIQSFGKSWLAKRQELRKKIE